MHRIPFWKKVPCIRLVIPFMAGIVIQFNYNLRLEALFLCWSVCFILISLFFFISLRSRFRLVVVNGIICCIMIAATGSIITQKNDIRNRKKWIGKISQTPMVFIARMKDMPVEKANSYRGIAELKWLVHKKNCAPFAGRIIINFKKDGKPPSEGTELVISKIPEPVSNSGNPGSFDFKTYCLFQGITHQLYVTRENYKIIKNEIGPVEKFIQSCRHLVLNCLKKNIDGRERGLAEALLIGYKDDLDKDLVQAYSRTGVVHIIAISGMHLALIYALLMWITYPLKKIRWLRTIIILTGLWIFTLMAGAQASVVRSAVMFTCLALGALSGRKTSIFNTLALSAFILLCYQPFWLWDVGFQLSYAAVLSILIFYRRIYALVYLPNKILDGIWKTVAVSLAAQIITTPFTLFYFHQFPLLFAFTNLLAVPLSGIILFTEIFLCLVWWNEPLSVITGHIAEWMICMMNSYIERINSISFAVWNGFSISEVQVMLMYIIIAGTAYWLIEKNRNALYISLIAIFSFGCIRAFSFFKTTLRQKLIIYNIPRHRAIGIFSGRTCFLFADSNLYSDKQAVDQCLNPSLILFRIKNIHACTIIPEIAIPQHRVMIIDSNYRFIQLKEKIKKDVVLISGRYRQNITSLYQAIIPSAIVADLTVPAWRTTIWKKECDSLHIFFYNMQEKGAFVMNL